MRLAGVVVILIGAGLPMLLDAKVARKPFGKAPDGTLVDLYTLSAGDVEAGIATYGGIVVSLTVPDKTGRRADIVLGHDSIQAYFKNDPYFGAIVGRYANRIGNASFSLGGKQYKLAANDGPNHLHGGIKGFDKAVWKARQVGESALELTYFSKDGEEGYPGNLRVTVVYAVTARELRIDYTATSDRDTVVNFTNHSYFNLAGQGEGDVLGHQLQLTASRFTPVDKGLIPTGELRPVEGTPFDFRKPAAVGARIESTYEQMKLGGGYDHNFVLDSGGGTLAKAAEVYEPKSGRVLEVWTTEPGMQLYTGNFLDGSIAGKGGKVYRRRYGLCLETQHFPDSPNKPSFPAVTLKSGQTFRSTTAFRFGAR
jgi:aldose 1-epimerase